MTTTKDSLKELKTWTLGVIGFATAISAFLVTVFGFDAGITSGIAALVAAVLVITVFLIDQAEKRNAKKIEDNRAEAIQQFNCCKDILKDVQESTLRTEMNNEIYRNPQNHDTILKMGRKYFIELGGDWVETDIFKQWIDGENAAGRKVNIPSGLFMNLSQKIDSERDKIDL